MSKKVNKKRFSLRESKGFTLIEVVLVIALGALIFLLAFIAFRNAQINRRDSQRRSDVDKIAAEVNNYASDKGGNVPKNTEFDAFMDSYVKGLNDPLSGTAYADISGNVNSDADPLSTAANGSVNYKSKVIAANANVKDCKGNNLTSLNSYAIRMKLEKGVACRDSSQN